MRRLYRAETRPWPVCLLFAICCISNANPIGSKACETCHPQIYRRYLATPMANTSGPADRLNATVSTPVEFADAGTGTRFRVERSANGLVAHYAQGQIAGTRRLDYFIGAGVLGQSFVSTIDGFLFQAPVAYYASTRQWDLSPGFEGSDHLNLTRPIEQRCLTCHASGLRPLSNSVNGYESVPFTEGGISCERCHGTGDVHVARMKSGDLVRGTGIVNPAKLNREERDSICAQCHLVGAIRIAKSRGDGPFIPGKKLFDTSAAFLWDGGVHPLPANSHFEQLVKSACWRRSGGRLWCGTCHDPHASKPEAASLAKYRQTCLVCHGQGTTECGAPVSQRQPVQDNCVTCHMPRKAMDTVQHSARVDHTIPRFPGDRSDASAGPTEAVLISFPGTTAGDREFGLAYASEALSRNDSSLGMRAIKLLSAALQADPDDASVSDQLGQLYDRQGQQDAACKLFAMAPKNNTAETGSLVNWGTCQAQAGELAAAADSWKQALSRNPGLEAARLNLAVAQFRLGDVEGARTNLKKALAFDPFLKRARELLQSMTLQ